MAVSPVVMQVAKFCAHCSRLAISSFRNKIDKLNFAILGESKISEVDFNFWGHFFLVRFSSPFLQV